MKITAYMVFGTALLGIPAAAYLVNPPTAASSSSDTTLTIAGGNGISTSLPTQPGMGSNCNSFVFVTKGGCLDVANQARIPIEAFYD